MEHSSRRSISREDMERAKNIFKKRFPSFRTFPDSGREYLEVEYDYKEKMILKSKKHFEKLTRKNVEKVFQKALKPTSEANLFNWRNLAIFEQLSAQDQGRLVDAIHALIEALREDRLQDDFDPIVDAIASILPDKSVVWLLVTYILFVFDPKKHMAMKSSFIDNVMKFFGNKAVARGTKITYDLYMETLEFVHEIAASLKEWHPRDMIDIHSFLWVVTQNMDTTTEDDIPPKETGENMKRNQILYGPPGTGKTYRTIDRALQIIDGDVPESRAGAKARFDALKAAGQIRFVTFHQSYGYEEFVEGIKADVQSDDIRYKIEDGIFKKLSKIAKKQYENSKKTSRQIADELSKRDKISQFLNNALDEEKIFHKTKGGKFRIKDLSDKSIVIHAEDSNYNENTLELSMEEFYDIIDSDIDFKSSKQLASDVFGVPYQRQKDTYYLSLYKDFKHSSFETKQIENTEPVKLQNYLLIIDEINRGNISKIFGELITLIEESKRLGSEEAMEVTLPYSGETFGVPSNLYILGTMNTADRSIALMDTALRRRFEFVEMMPDASLLEGIEIGGVKIDQLLERINRRIEYLYDRDHTIGHAYFLPLRDAPSLEGLNGIFRHNVIPLLQEYFYDDWEKIQMVLGDHPKQGVKDDEDKFIVEKKVEEMSLFGFDHDEVEDERYTYTINGHFTLEAYRKILGAAT